jgi:hypothetical protein
MFEFGFCRNKAIWTIFQFVFVLCIVPSASAGNIDSAYTKIKLQDCVLIEPAAEEGTYGGAFECVGFQGMPVRVAEGDLRMFVSFGLNANQEPAAEQTLPNFNTVNETLEWRLRNGVPFATILRWFPSVDESGKTGSILIVTQLLPGGGTCWIAKIDAQANKNANVLARQAADTMAGTTDCSQGAIILGNPGIFHRG